MKVSFDFDGTLDRPSVQAYASELISRGVGVWVHTCRYSNERAPSKNWNKDLEEVCSRLGIDNIVFCEMSDKWIFLKDKGFAWHLDDDWMELDLLNRNGVRGISVFGNSSWKYKCDKFLK